MSSFFPAEARIYNEHRQLLNGGVRNLASSEWPSTSCNDEARGGPGCSPILARARQPMKAALEARPHASWRGEKDDQIYRLRRAHKSGAPTFYSSFRLKHAEESAAPLSALRI